MTVMRTNTRSAALLLGLAAVLCVPAGAQAQSSKLEVLVAAVSTSGAHVDPALSQLAQSFKRNGLAFTDYKLVHRSSLNLKQGETGSVPLTNGKASVTLVKREPDGKLRIRLNAPGSASEYEITPGGELSLQVGTVPGGKLFLVIRG